MSYLEATTVFLCTEPSFSTNFEMRKNIEELFICYMKRLAQKSEQSVCDLLSRCFAGVLDGRTGGSTHYIGVFATFPLCSSIGYRKVIILIYPMEDHTTRNANQHTECIDFVLLIS